MSTNINNGLKKSINVFVFCGQGSQYNKMHLSLYENEKIFKEWVDKFDKEFLKYYGYSILSQLRSISDEDLVSIHEPILAQPSNVMMQISLFELYKHYGIMCDIVVGHSLGELSSPYCSGMIDFETLCYLTYRRSVAQNKLNGTGKMLVINLSADEYVKNYSSRFPSIEIACYNSPNSIVIAGEESLLNEIRNELKPKQLFTYMLGSLSSFHTSSQLLIKNEILSIQFKSFDPKIPVFSTVTTDLFNHSLPFNAEYNFNSILLPVKFNETISNIYKYIQQNDWGNQVTFIEISPQPTLKFYLDQMKSQQSDYFKNGENITSYSPCDINKNDYQEFLKLISIFNKK